MSKLGIALIGAGFIADYHLGGLAGTPEAEVRVVASRNLKKAREVAGRGKMRSRVGTRPGRRRG